MAHTAEELDVVALEAHAGPAPEPEPAARQLVADLLHRDGEARGQAFDHHGECGAVGLTGRQESQHPEPPWTTQDSGTPVRRPGPSPRRRPAPVLTRGTR